MPICYVVDFYLGYCSAATVLILEGEAPAEPDYLAREPECSARQGPRLPRELLDIYWDTGITSVSYLMI